MKRSASTITGPLLLVLLGLACTSQPSGPSQAFSIGYEKFTLENGLEVVMHRDTSDPVAAVALTFHVGSAREKTGRTGFAHLFEHLLFLESENLGKGGLDKMSSRIGGSGANGSTSRDRTNYFQTVPNDALEKMIWAEADKLGYFINTVTEPVLEKEKQVVKNEKRQSYDNRPYGHTNYVIYKNLYPEGHPYNWQVIGSLEDLQHASLEDVKEFYRRWYVPNNATLTLAGDFDFDQARKWVEKYFAEIPTGQEIIPMEAQPAQLAASVRRYHEDNFARLPEIHLSWPAVPSYHPDEPALEILAEALADGKESPFYEVIVAEQQLAPNVRMYSTPAELAGEFHLTVRAYPDTDLDSVYAAIKQAFARFEAEGIAEATLRRIQAGMETQYYSQLSSVLGKAIQMGLHNAIAGDPEWINRQIQQTLNVSTDDVVRVYHQYIKDKPFVMTNFVPQGQQALAVEGSEKAEVVEEQIITGAEAQVDPSVQASYERTPSSFDRSVEPPYGPAPEVRVPEVWQEPLPNGLGVWGITSNELPLVQFTLRMKGGLLLEAPEKNGVANMVAEMMTKGTREKTPEELDAAIKALGASLNVYADKEAIFLRGSCVERNFPATWALAQEILLQPRWDSTEFVLVKQEVLSDLAQQKASPNSLATQYFDQLLYGEGHPLASNLLGTEASVQAITLEDLKAYYEANISPGIADFHLAGAATQTQVLAQLEGLAKAWAGPEVQIPAFSLPEKITSPTVYFYDVPNAKQSVFRFGYLALSANDPDFYPATVMNYILGGGGFASRLTQELREGKGYTYGIRSGFDGTNIPGPFSISTGVRSNITYEATALIREIMADYPGTFTAADLETTQSFLQKSNARAFENLGAKLNLLENMSAYGWPADYVKAREKVVAAMTVDNIRKLAETYANPDHMIYLIIGDAATQLPRLRQLGIGAPVLLNPET